MYKITLVIGMFFLTVSCQDKKNEERKENKEKPNKVLSYNFDTLEKMLHQKDDKIHVINFWATWCAPCVKELPYFIQLKEKNEIELVLVSLDFPATKDTQLLPFLKKNNIHTKVVLLDDPNSNEWIPKVNKDWQGAIPATLIYKNDRSVFYPKEFKNYIDLEQALTKFKN